MRISGPVCKTLLDGCEAVLGAALQGGTIRAAAQPPHIV